LGGSNSSFSGGKSGTRGGTNMHSGGASRSGPAGQAAKPHSFSSRTNPPPRGNLSSHSPGKPDLLSHGKYDHKPHTGSSWNHDRDWWQHKGHDGHWSHRGHDHDRWYGSVWWGWPLWFSWGFYDNFWPCYYGRDVAVYNYYDAVPASPSTYVYYPPEGADSAEAPADAQPAGAESGEFYNDALGAFQQGDYRNALRLAAHASIDWPKDPKPHELASLAFFALGNYRMAAQEAHAAASLGPMSDWATVAGFYNNEAQKYTDQLRALEKFVDEHKADAGARFLLGYQYLITNYRDAAKKQFTEVVKAVPQDKLAAQLLERAGGKAPAAPAPPKPEPPKEM
jgi:hypothetical protein